MNSKKNDSQEEHHSSIKLADGFSLTVAEGGTGIVLHSNGQAAIKIQLTPNGPVIEMDAPEVTLTNTGQMTLEADALAFKARSGMQFQCGGDMSQKVAGNMDVSIRDDFQLTSQAMKMEAVMGGMELKASDDIDLQGLRILHNVPSEEEVMEKLAKVRTFADWMACPALNPDGPGKMKPIPPKPRKDW